MINDLFSLSAWASGQNNIESLLENTLNSLEKIPNFKKTCFCIINKNELILQAGSKEIDLSHLFQIFQKAKPIKAIAEEAFILLPVFIKEQLVALIIIETQSSCDLEALDDFAKIFSNTLSRIHEKEELENSYRETLEQNRIKTELLATISHELRTPMANILGFSELLSIRDFNPVKQKEYQEEIYKSAQRLSNMINNFLDLARIEDQTGPALSSFQKSNICELIDKAWAAIKHINQDYQLKLESENEPVYAQVDAEAITRVFINLFSNAIKYAAESKEILCSIKNRRNNIEICVKDYGRGIDADELESIFKRFYRSEKAKNHTVPGTGLGLWICKEVIEAHQGRIWCESEVNSGSSFCFTLPIGN